MKQEEGANVKKCRAGNRQPLPNLVTTSQHVPRSCGRTLRLVPMGTRNGDNSRLEHAVLVRRTVAVGAVRIVEEVHTGVAVVGTEEALEPDLFSLRSYAEP